MFAPHLPHQIFAGWLFIRLAIQVDALGIGNAFIAPVDVVIDGINTFQPDLMYVSNERRHIFDGHGITGAPDVVVEVLSESTRRYDLNVKLPVYARSGVREMWTVDLGAETVSKYVGSGESLTLERVYHATDTLVSDAMPGVAIDLAPIFALVRGVAFPDG